MPVRGCGLVVLLLATFVGKEAGSPLPFSAPVLRGFEGCAVRARRRLLRGLAVAPTEEMKTSNFRDVVVALPLVAPMLPTMHGTEDDKRTISHELLVAGESRLGGSKCLVYGIGIASNSAFEEAKAAHAGCEVHAFDCTITAEAKSVKNKHFVFHDWCIGESETSKAANISVSEKHKAQGGRKTATYDNMKSLRDTMLLLNHTAVDILKFDIEGFEWALFKKEFLKLPLELRPLQVSFELHTRGAREKWVPAQLVKPYKHSQVNRLFLALMNFGYRVISREVNAHDPFCAEFVIVRMDNLPQRRRLSLKEEVAAELQLPALPPPIDYPLVGLAC
eukprot:m.16560 g.16560  ORF g.16560 m.16560 type:complete len:334 (-) comp5061_c0_seq2:628-1629(-)